MLATIIHMPYPYLSLTIHDVIGSCRKGNYFVMPTGQRPRVTSVGLAFVWQMFDSLVLAWKLNEYSAVAHHHAKRVSMIVIRISNILMAALSSMYSINRILKGEAQWPYLTGLGNSHKVFSTGL